jgi:hypothetical protein
MRHFFDRLDRREYGQLPVGIEDFLLKVFFPLINTTDVSLVRAGKVTLRIERRIQFEVLGFQALVVLRDRPPDFLLLRSLMASGKKKCRHEKYKRMMSLILHERLLFLVILMRFPESQVVFSVAIAQWKPVPLVLRAGCLSEYAEGMALPQDLLVEVALVFR